MTRARPLRFLALVLGLWIGARAVHARHARRGARAPQDAAATVAPATSRAPGANAPPLAAPRPVPPFEPSFCLLPFKEPCLMRQRSRVPARRAYRRAGARTRPSRVCRAAGPLGAGMPSPRRFREPSRVRARPSCRRRRPALTPPSASALVGLGLAAGARRAGGSRRWRRAGRWAGARPGRGCSTGSAAASR